MHDPAAPPSEWVRRFAPLIARGGRALDLACGSGRHTRLLREMGLRVTAVDRDRSAIAVLGAIDGVEALVADLEGAPWPLAGRRFDGIVVTNFLHRPLFPRLIEALSEDGVLIYETFAAGNERFGRPSNPEFLLRRGELLRLASPELDVVAFEQGVVASPRPAVIERICAVCSPREWWPLEAAGGVGAGPLG